LTTQASITSADGRFEIRVNAWLDDRGAPESETVLIERATQRVIANLSHGLNPRFTADGHASVEKPDWTDSTVEIDPASEQFRTQGDSPWLPLSAWSAIDSAYRRGWTHGINFRTREASAVFPWPEIAIALSAAAALLLLAWKPWLDSLPRVVLLCIAALCCVVFSYLAIGAMQRWQKFQQEAHLSA